MGQLSATAAEWTQTIAPKTGRMLMNSICLDDTAAKVLAGSHNHNLHIFDLSNGQLCNEHTLRLNEGPINCIRLSAPMDGVRDAFVACYSGSIVRVSLDGEIKGKFKLHDGAVKSVRTHPEKALGVSGAADGSLITWDFNGQQIKRLQGHTAIVDDIDFDPSGKFVASVSRDFTVNVYDVDSGCMLHSILLGRQSPKCVLFWSQDTVIVGNYWGHLLRVRLSNQKVSSHKIAINGISALARCGKYLIAVSYDGGAYLVNPEDMTVIRFLRTMHQKLPEFRDGASFD
jgi:WD40 repeat protein